METKNNDRISQPVVEQMREATREGMEQSYILSKQMLDAWTAGTEATLKASYDLQNAAIVAGNSLLGTADNYNQVLYKQWAESVRLAQKATLDALNATKSLTKQFGPKIEAKEPTSK